MTPCRVPSGDGRPAPGARLLAVDLGLRTGLAVFDARPGLLHYASRNFGSRTRLRGGADAVLRESAPVDVVVVEGDRALAELWGVRARRHGARTLTVAPECWRERLLHPRERRSAREAKAAADGLARLAIEAFGGARPTSLRHDAAEAILIGLWGLLEIGWLRALPATLDPRRR